MKTEVRRHLVKNVCFTPNGSKLSNQNEFDLLSTDRRTGKISNNIFLVLNVNMTQVYCQPGVVYNFWI